MSGTNIEGRCPHCGSAAITWTREAVLQAIRDWTAKHGKPPAHQEWVPTGPGRPSMRTVHKFFATLAAARDEAGVKQVRRGVHRLPSEWTREQILAAIFEWRYENGVLPTRGDWNSPVDGQKWPTAYVVRKLFGSWNAAIVAAGYEPFQPHFRQRSKHSYRAEMAEITKAST